MKHSTNGMYSKHNESPVGIARAHVVVKGSRDEVDRCRLLF